MRFVNPGRVVRYLLGMRCAGCVAGAVCVALVCWQAAGAAVDTTAPARSHAAKTAKIVALSPWEQAERGRETLEAMAESDRTRADYTRAMDAYRAIYHANPADVYAPAAVNAVAELLAEQGRTLHDAKASQAAVGQYEFLRKQYPGSSLRVQALLAEGQIEEDDLADAAAAKEKYALLLKEHPRSEQAEEAKAGLESLRQGMESREQGTGKMAGRTATIAPTVGANAASAGTERNGSNSSAPRRASASNGDPGVGADQSESVPKPTAGGASSLPATAPTSGKMDPTHHDSAVMNGTPSSVAVPLARRDEVARDVPPVAVVDVEADPTAAKRSGKRAVVTGIRHWSTATYTRVAIDLGDNVTYEAARVPNPDRIFFDLHGTRLAQELVGKSFAVTDDGFLKKIRAAQYSDDVTRVVLDVNDVTEYSAFLLPNPYRLIIDIHGGKQQAAKDQASGIRDQGSAGTGDGMSSADVPAPHAAGVARPTPARPVPNTVATRTSTSDVANLSELPGKVDATSKPTSKPISAVVADAGPRTDAAQPAHDDKVVMNAAVSPARTRKAKAKAASADAVVADATPARAAVPTADGETSLVRALGLKIGRIVIDAGHGGHDSGTLGADGIEEKDVVLDVALRLGKLLHDRLGAEVVYTRSDDTFIPLETRTAIANKAQADLFLSIHANSSSDPTARGVETYYLNFTSDPTALDVAARENAVSDQSIHQLSDLVKKIALKDKIEESREFAADVESSLYAGLQKGNAGLKDRGVKKAPFVVLIGANMPSILAEISFVTNPKDADQLQQPEYRERVAESLYKGVARYEGGLSGMRVPTERAQVGQ